MLMARDGAGLIEIQLRLQKCLNSLTRIGPAPFREAARRQAVLAAGRARHALEFKGDLERLEALARKLPAAV